jgi:hypothetical protein
MDSIETFPFGSPVTARPPSGEGHRPLFILGAYPSALHVRWQPPENAPKTKPINALAVADEPSPFWPAGDAIEEASRVEMWCKSVDFSPAWGTVAPAGSANGSSGRWLDKHILEPLGCARQDAWITDCLDTYRLSSGQASRIADTYDPNAIQLGLPPVEISAHPTEAEIVAEAVKAHRPRLLAELEKASPQEVVTLGNAALRVFATLVESSVSTPPRFLTQSGYGAPVEVRVNGRSMTWRPLVHPGARFGKDPQSWPGSIRAGSPIETTPGQPLSRRAERASGSWVLPDDPVADVDALALRLAGERGRREVVYDFTLVRTLKDTALGREDRRKVAELVRAADGSGEVLSLALARVREKAGDAAGLAAELLVHARLAVSDGIGGS